MFGLSPFSLILIAIIAIMLFGSDLPEVARKFGSRYREFRRSINDVQQQFREIQRETSDALKVDTSDDHRRAELDDEEEDEPQAPRFTPPS
ncbi:Sec-independent protein translocase subunit TatA/TatB [Crateriforma conspicua]|uniref:Sec-independent translocase n=1 Tax=Crateriforma conspicua TaxID=2527996 RepID=A0A5C5Y542_9PLAN|nr:twin-arginine translocase TatA/TatE family subunit [Crateriforma conspicua]QDV64423.1 sec-independent translocase [Crateriforma conspicua]TWT69823.1 sec-independent translocase [Crateriforma conspicua]